MDVIEEIKPVVILVTGMAGSGKTSFIGNFKRFLSSHYKAPYVINLDPAVDDLPYLANIDIRDIVNIHQVMSDDKLGFNGGIMRCCAMMTVNIDDLLHMVDENIKDNTYILIDTPGQSEVFTMSAVGWQMMDSFSNKFKTMIIHLVDTNVSSNPLTFIANMMFASHVATKTDLPMIVAANKIDEKNWDSIESWMNDVGNLKNVLSQIEVSDPSDYTGSFVSSLSLIIEPFFQSIHRCGISCKTKEGFSHLLDIINEIIAKENMNSKIEPLN